jgi:hypothetical protein
LTIKSITGIAKIVEKEAFSSMVITEYAIMRSRGIPGKKAREGLADKYCIAEKTVQKILYAKPTAEDIEQLQAISGILQRAAETFQQIQQQDEEQKISNNLEKVNDE